MVDMPGIPDEDHDFTPDMARKIIGLYQTHIAALEAKLAERVKVKPLEWVDGRNCECSAETVVGMYEVGFDDGWWAQLEGGVTWDWEPDQDPRSYEGPGAAKAAAQADFDRRILSALEDTLTAAQEADQ